MWSRLWDLYRYRVLVQSLVLRELKARYRGSVLGFLWSFLNPLLLMGVYTLVFSVYMRNPMEHYAVFLFCGLLPWLWFATSLSNGAASITAGGHLLKKVAFPAEILPVVAVLHNLINFILGIPILLLFILAFGRSLAPSLAAFPVVVLIQWILTTGIVLVLAALNVYLRDIEQVLGNLLTLLFFMTPILYPLSLVPEAYRPFLLLNPLAPLMLAYQDIFYYGRFPHWGHLAILGLLAVLVFWLGYVIFDRFRDTLVEEV